MATNTPDEALPLDVSDEDRARLAAYGLVFIDDPWIKRGWNNRESVTLYPLQMATGAKPLLWYRPVQRRYTYQHNMGIMSHTLPSYNKANKRNGDEANWDLDRFLRDSDRLLALSEQDPDTLRPLFAEVLNFYVTWNERMFVARTGPKRSFADCVRIAQHPAADKEPLRELWSRRIPVDMLLLVLEGMHPSLILEFAEKKRTTR